MFKNRVDRGRGENGMREASMQSGQSARIMIGKTSFFASLHLTRILGALLTCGGGGAAVEVRRETAF